MLVFFHGGGFVSGSSSSLGPEYLMDPGSVVVVTANYRLGPLGWISNEDEQMPGEQGERGGDVLYLISVLNEPFIVRG